jgi:hypothetical protein
MMLTDRETEENSKAAVYCGSKKKNHWTISMKSSELANLR